MNFTFFPSLSNQSIVILPNKIVTSLSFQNIFRKCKINYGKKVSTSPINLFGGLGGGAERFFNLPEQFSDLPDYFSGLPEQFSDLPDYFSGLPEQFLDLPDHFSSLPEQFSKLPDHFSGLPEQFSDLPDHFSSLPEQFFQLPERFTFSPKIKAVKRNLHDFSK
ncbi:hypothetical protein [Lysinibacillus xylanilyticus]|uniref:hypothetical protein n=1 Tax=Lysinibacillus xylanilyticus TaxID=582475 RepID=UPI00381661EA